MSQLSPRITKKHLVLDRLTAIRLHADRLRRRFRRDAQVDPVFAAQQLGAISADVDAAADLVRQLTEPDEAQPEDAAGPARA